MDAVRATGHSDAIVDYTLLIEATRLADAQEIRRDAVSTGALEQAGWTDRGFGIYSLMYEVSGINTGVDTILGDRL